MTNDIKVHFLGTNGWYSSQTGDTTCHLLELPNCYIILDAGNAIYKIDEHIIENKPIYLFLSHFHMDHIFGLHILNKFHFEQTLTICCYDGGEKILNNILNHPFTMPIKQLGYKVKIKEIYEGYNKGFPFKLRAQKLVHLTKCFGYRFEYEEKIITYCTDTGPCSSIKDLANKADLLIAECSLKPGQAALKNWPHMSPKDAALHAYNSQVKKLALIHFDADNYPTLEHRKNAIIEAKKYFPDIIGAIDYDTIII